MEVVGSESEIHYAVTDREMLVLKIFLRCSIGLAVVLRTCAVDNMIKCV